MQASVSQFTPAAEVQLDRALVEQLLVEQHPDLAHLPLQVLNEGWDNQLFRLGDQLVIRFPRRQIAARLIEHEQRWLALLAPALPLPVPVPLRTGCPAHGYPWHWSIVPWITGDTADRFSLSVEQAQLFGAFLRALHQPAPGDAPPNPVRGVPLAQRVAAYNERQQRLSSRHHLVDVVHIAVWERAVLAPFAEVLTWIHGDLHPGNVLVEAGRITGVIDWGDMCAGDCATDLASIWMLFDSAAARQAMMSAYGPIAPATLFRAQGWALHMALSFLEVGLSENTSYAALGEHVIQRLLDDQPTCA